MKKFNLKPAQVILTKLDDTVLPSKVKNHSHKEITNALNESNYINKFLIENENKIETENSINCDANEKIKFGNNNKINKKFYF